VNALPDYWPSYPSPSVGSFKVVSGGVTQWSVALSSLNRIVTRHGVWIGNWIYWTLRTRNYKELYRYR
jgi:hypothetical protein